MKNDWVTEYSDGCGDTCCTSFRTIWRSVRRGTPSRRHYSLFLGAGGPLGLRQQQSHPQ